MKTKYSEKIPGDAGNYNWVVSFDLTRGYLGINLLKDGEKLDDRVLLSPGQVKALLKFLGAEKK